MTAREKRLVVILVGLAVAIGGLFGFEVFRKRLGEARVAKDQARLTLDNAELFLEMRERFADQIDWLAQHEPEPQTIQEVQPELQRFATREAENNGLQVQSPKLLPAAENPGYYGRARVQMTVTGTEAALYRWLYLLQSPEAFRTVISMDLAPLRDDDTQITCTVVIEQWFVPDSPAAS